MPDKYAATWVSHSSLNDFRQCPRAYYLKNVYKDPKQRKKVQITSPALSLGSAVHEVLEALSEIETSKRFERSLHERFDVAWKQYRGKRGGFFDTETEQRYKLQGEEMLSRVTQHPGPLKELAVKIREELPHYWLSEEDEIILCGKIDWLAYEKDTDSVHIIDFKTGKHAVTESSLQLPIYYLLVKNTQQREVTGLSYWYLRTENEPTLQELPALKQAHEAVLAAAKEVRLARKLQRFICPKGELGCRQCQPFERVIAGDAEFVGESTYGQLVYVLPPAAVGESESTIL